MFSSRVVGVLGVLFAFVSSAGAQVATGMQPHGTMISKGADVINVGNNNVFFNLPIISKQGRGAPFSYSISLNSSIWYIASSGSSSQWLPVSFDGSALGWQGINPQASVGATYTVTENTTTCPNTYYANNDAQAYTQVYVFFPANYLAAGGISHALSDNHTPMIYFVSPNPSSLLQNGHSCPPTGPSGPPSVALTTSDGSGYTGTMSFASNSSSNPTPVFQIKDANGNTYNPPATASQSGFSGPLTTTDANGNQVTENNGQYTDTTGNTVLSLVYQAASSGQTNPNGQTTTIPAHTTLQYNTPPSAGSSSGGTASYQVNYGTYTVATNFQLYNSNQYKNVGEYGPVSTNLVSQIVAPDGGVYQFYYESTPGQSGSVTGRISEIILPSGGTINYQYTGGSNGINLDGTTPTLTRTTTDGTATFVRSGNTTTVTDEKNNQSVYTFETGGGPNYFETDRKIYQGTASGTPLQEILTAYSNSVSPITEVDATSSFNGGSQLLTKTTYDSSGTVVTNVAQYSGSTLLENTANAYTISPPLYELNSTTVTDGGGNTVALTKYTYDGGSLVATSNLPQHLSVTGARGNPTSTQISIDGTSSNYLTTSMIYFDTGQLQSLSTPSGITTFGYDSTQTFVQSTTLPSLPSGVALSTSANYDLASGALLSTTGVNSGQTATMTTFDGFLRPQTMTPVSGPQITMTRSINPSQTTMTRGGTSNTQQLDGYGRASRAAVYNGQSNAATAWYQTDSCYDAAGMLSFQSLSYAGPGLGPQATSKQCSGTGIQYTYDALGRVVQTSNSDGAATIVYNGRAVKTTDVNGVQKITQRDLYGRISAICEISSNSGMPMSGSPVACGTDIAGSGFLTTYAYSLASHTTTITQGAQTRVFQTDAAGRTIYTSEPERGITTYKYTYNSTGLQVVRTRPLANQVPPAAVNGTTPPPSTTTTTTQYDLLGRILNVTYADGTPAKQFVYDQASTNGGSAYNKGQMTNASTLQPSGTVLTSNQLNYSILGNVSDSLQCFPSQCSNSGYNISRLYAYDPVVGGRTQESFYVGGASGTRVDTNMTYSVAGELLTMANTLSGTTYNSGSIISNTQNSVYGPTAYTLGNGLNAVQTYDGLGRKSGISLCANSTAFGCSGGSQTYQMTQTVSGSQVTAMSDTVLGTNASPTYDEFARLSGISYGTRQQAFTYTYDRYGNRWFQTVTQGSGPSPQLSYNVANNQLSVTGYSYDAAGNMTSDGTHSYFYDAEGNILNVDGGRTATYVYDAFNHRIRVTTPSADTYFTFNSDGQRVATWNATSPTPTMLAAYSYWNGRPIATYSGGTVNYPHQDLLGTKRLITASTGSTVATFQSLPFGDNFTSSGTDSDPAHFALLDHDAESGTDHAQDRQYASTSGAWMSPDPYDGSYSLGNPQTLNRYTYASNNPLAYVDPLGQIDCPPGSTNTDADAKGQAACEQAAGLAGAVAGPNCSTTISAACGTPPLDPTETGEGAIANYESYSMSESDRAEASYVNLVNQRYWMDQANIWAATARSQTNFVVISYWWKGAGGFGHIGIGVDTYNTKGFSTVDPEVPILDRIFGDPAGQPENDIDHHTSDDGVVQPVSYLYIPITSDQAQAMRDAIDNASPSNYNFITNNCAQYVETILHAGGVSGVPHSVVFGPAVLASVLWFVYGK